MFRFLAIVLLIGAVTCEDTPNAITCKSSWAPYHSADPTESGVKIFYKFLEVHPEIKDEFPKFKGVSMADLKSNADFRAHATKIYHVIDDAVMKQNWEDVDTLSTFHKGIGKTDKAQFDAFRSVFFDSIVKYNPASADAWTACLDKFFEHFYSSF